MQGDSTSHPTYVETSSGISSNNNAARRPSMKTLSVLPSRKPTNAVPVEKRQLEIQYTSKRMRYTNLKKTLVDKQKMAQDMHDEISSLREKIIAAGGKDPGKIEELRSLQVECPKQSPPTPIETSSRCDAPEQREPICMDESVVIGVSLLQNELRNICDRSQEICQRTLDKSSSFASLVKFWLTESSRQDETGNVLIPADYSAVEAQQAKFTRDNEEMRTQLDDLRTAQTDFVAEFALRSSSLRCEYNNYRERVKEERPNVDRGDLLQAQLSVALEELKAERDKASQGKERTRMLELQTQKARAKVRELEGHVANEEVKSQQLENSVKSLEAQLKQKDQAMELRLKDMHKAMKSSEGLVTKMEKQRDSLESRMLELKEKMARKEAEANATIKELSVKFETTNAEFTEEKDKRQQAESALIEMEGRCKHLEEKSQLLCDLASEKSNNITVTDNNHTENEICLYNDLMTARAELERQREKIKQLEREKQEIVAVMHQAASHDNEDETKDRLAAELVAKTNDLQNLMLEHARLQKIARFAQERNDVLENQLSEIQHRLQARSKENGKGLDTTELQQQISDLRNSLAETIQQNQELETALTQKQLEVEQRDRVMREQSKFLKVRDELLSLLKGKQANAANPNENYEEDIHEINKQIASKTEAIQELYTTLEGKQMQVMRLEKLVKLLEDQQDRAQAQRTRLEHRIAQLEVSLREKSKNDSNRYVVRKYLRKPRSSIANDRLSRALSYESRRALLEASAPYRYFSRHVPPTKSSDPPPRKFHPNDWCRISSDKEEAFVCERCRRKVNENFRDDVIHHVGNRRVQGSLYGWLVDSSTLGAFGEPTSRLNKFHGELSSEEDADCLDEIVNPIVVRDNAKDCNRESHRCRKQHYCQYRGRLPRRSLLDACPRRCNPIIRAT
ncbi:PREDICTED: spindle pole body component 110-like [Vollenhovia emeryi]|uniref:spindle pole body component 110-like n=1 Tax=Vollenhovia emeryi TaxID=411798 RepID=UPI0005F37901|nr:PREDICTED: spindle pole body component 110-like [Vollenhovia emeryi]XP_011873811.1 PREDICTED: spindle pole body component 110-like [Vollenhovia emeryi]